METQAALVGTTESEVKQFYKSDQKKALSVSVKVMRSSWKCVKMTKFECEKQDIYRKA